MNRTTNDPRHPWARLTAAARAVPDNRDEASPYGFATRIAALAMAQERVVVSLFERFSLRALGVSCLLALCSVAINYHLISSPIEEELPTGGDAVAVVFDLAD